MYRTCLACMVHVLLVWYMYLHVLTFADVRQIDGKKKFVLPIALVQKGYYITFSYLNN